MEGSTREVTCYKCNGSGYIKAWNAPLYGENLGDFDSNYDEVQCPDCHGSGTVTQTLRWD